MKFEYNGKSADDFGIIVLKLDDINISIEGEFVCKKSLFLS